MNPYNSGRYDYFSKQIGIPVQMLLAEDIGWELINQLPIQEEQNPAVKMLATSAILFNRDTINFIHYNYTNMKRHSDYWL